MLGATVNTGEEAALADLSSGVTPEQQMQLNELYAAVGRNKGQHEEAVAKTSAQADSSNVLAQLRMRKK